MNKRVSAGWVGFRFVGAKYAGLPLFTVCLTTVAWELINHTDALRESMGTKHVQRPTADGHGGEGKKEGGWVFLRGEREGGRSEGKRTM